MSSACTPTFALIGRVIALQRSIKDQEQAFVRPALTRSNEMPFLSASEAALASTLVRVYFRVLRRMLALVLLRSHQVLFLYLRLYILALNKNPLGLAAYLPPKPASGP